MIPNTSREVLNIIAKQLDKQNSKGLSTYGTTIDEASNDDYNWNDEALAELADACQYLVKENKRLRVKVMHYERHYENSGGIFNRMNMKQRIEELEKENELLRLNEQRLILTAQKRVERYEKAFLEIRHSPDKNLFEYAEFCLETAKQALEESE
ncbi:hypothetical protein [Halalkalibacterium ligniniphilum]|uniref:hypothetical protein n=1 Tax=Halalkalibacterium ligniniphilum TaxID=1134413 RepID=UPI00034C8B2D|nr:hypothetical protein [Halalkalibacterium ligniniphilum]